MSTVRELLRRKGWRLVCVDAGLPATQCAERMLSNDVGSLVVMQAEQMSGILTRRDLVRAVAEQPESLHELQARDLMSSPIESIDESASFEEAESLMMRENIRHLPVTRDGTVVGIITRIDVLRRHLDEATATNRDLELYISNAYPG